MADGQVRAHERGRGWAVVCLVAIVAGLIGLATLAYWYGTDMGWTGSGSVLVVSRTPIALAGLVSVTAVLLGVSTMLIGPAIEQRSLKGVWLVGTTLLVAVSIVVALAAYPQVRDLTAATVTIEGSADRRECRSEWRSVTIDRATGAIVEVEPLPSSYDDASEIPTDPDPVDPALFEVVQGSAPFICRS